MDPTTLPDFSALAGAKLCVLFGGRSSEREVSLSSGHCILQAFEGSISRAACGAPLGVLGVEILANGLWLVDREALAPGEALARLSQVDLFFLGLHGTDGEDGCIQGLLSVHDKRFTGSGVHGSAVCMDKEFSRRLVSSSGLCIARGQHFTRDQWIDRSEPILDELSAWEGPGWVIKPRCEGSSIGVSVVHSATEIGAAMERAFEHGSQVIVEECILGIEVAAGVLHGPGGCPEALPIVEICPKPGHFFDYEEKYSVGGAIEHCPPLNVPPETCALLQKHALLAHESLRCEGYSRTDFIVPASGLPVFLETNTLPGMTPRSLMPLAARAAGIDFPMLCSLIALEGLTRNS